MLGTSESANSATICGMRRSSRARRDVKRLPYAGGRCLDRRVSHGSRLGWRDVQHFLRGKFARGVGDQVRDGLRESLGSDVGEELLPCLGIGVNDLVPA